MGKYYSKETDWHTYCQMTKIVLMSNRCDVLYSRENNPRIGGVNTSQAVEYCFRGVWGKSHFPLLKFWPHCVACEILVPRPGFELMSSALKSQNLNHWTARESF